MTNAKNEAAVSLGSIRTAKKAASSAANGRSSTAGGRPADLTIDSAGPWRLYWSTPLPQGAQALGTVTRNARGAVGALLLLASGVYVQGNAGALRSLPQSQIKSMIGRHI